MAALIVGCGKAQDTVNNEPGKMSAPVNTEPDKNYANAKADGYELVEYTPPQNNNIAVRNLANLGKVDPIIKNGIEKGIVLGHNGKTIVPEKRYYDFINEAYCKYNEKNSLFLELNQYPPDDAVKFPEDIPPGTIVTYRGTLKLADIQKDANGKRMIASAIEISSPKQGQPPVNIFAFIYESDIADRNRIEKIMKNNSSVYVTGMLGGTRDNNNRPITFLAIHDIYRRINLDQRVYQAIKDNRQGKIYIFAPNSIVVCNGDYSVERTVDLDKKYTPQYANYDTSSDTIIVGLLNNETKEIEHKKFDYDELIRSINNTIKNAQNQNR